MATDIELHPVTRDPAQMRELIERWGNATRDQEFEEHAYSLGLYPPGYQAGHEYSVSLVFPPGSTSDDDGVLIWNTSRLDGSWPTSEPDTGEVDPPGHPPTSAAQGCTEPPPF